MTKNHEDGPGEIPEVTRTVGCRECHSPFPPLLSGRSYQNLDPRCILRAESVFDFVQIKRLAGRYGESNLSFAAIRLDGACLYPR
jgi:hypothetical protein